MQENRSLLCKLTTEIEYDGKEDRYVVEIPDSEIELGSVDPTGAVQMLLYEIESTGQQRTVEQQSQELNPPVEEGDTVSVVIEGIGDEGDGIAKVDGFVVIVPGEHAQVGRELDVEITKIADKKTYALSEPITGEQSQTS